MKTYQLKLTKEELEELFSHIQEVLGDFKIDMVKQRVYEEFERHVEEQVTEYN